METTPMVPDSLRRRLDVSKRAAVRHARTIRDPRSEAVRSSADLEKRISNLERLVGLLTDMLLGLISACFAIVGAAFAGGGFLLAGDDHRGCHRIFDCDLGFTIFFSRMRRDVSAIARHEKTRREGRVSQSGPI